MTMDARSAFVGAGANRGERLANLRRAARHLAAGDAVSNLEASPVYETEAHTPDPDDDAPSYLNAVLRLRTTLSPEALLDACQSIEREAGLELHRHVRVCSQHSSGVQAIYRSYRMLFPGFVLDCWIDRAVSAAIARRSPETTIRHGER